MPKHYQELFVGVEYKFVRSSQAIKDEVCTGVRCELQGGAGHCVCPQEACVCHQDNQARGSEMVINYCIFLGAMTVCSPQDASGPALVSQSETRAHRCFVAVSYLAADLHCSSSGDFDFLGESLWQSDDASRYFAKVIFLIIH